MKQHLILAAILLAAIACSKPNSPTSPTKEYFRGKVNGVFFSDSAAQISTEMITRYSLRLANITGRYTDGQISLAFWIEIGEQHLTCCGPGLYEHIYIYPNGGRMSGIDWAGGSGKINILELTDSYVRGTFEGITIADSTVPPTSITEGEFNLKY